MAVTLIYSAIAAKLFVPPLAYEKRRIRHQYRQEVASFKEHLWSVMNSTQTTDLLSRISVPPLASGLSQELAQSPIGMWCENVPKQTRFFTAIRDFQQADTEFMRDKNNLLASVSL